MAATEHDRVCTSRGTIIESTHLVHAAVVSTSGNLHYAVGNPYRTTLLRSAAKPAQTVAILEACSQSNFGFSPADLALMSASHSSEPRHIERAKSMLDTVGAEEKDLMCGGHPALSTAINRDWIRRDLIPGGICNNCSGKHAGMLGGARALNGGFDGYHRPEHPMQQLVKQVVEDLSSLKNDEVIWAIDGCNLPAPAMPLNAMAGMYAKFADAASQAGTARQKKMKCVFEAMQRYPEMVGGEGRFCTELMSVYDGLLIGKLGADGCYGIGIKESKYTENLGIRGSMGIAIKIEDGNINILYAAVMEILTQLGIGEAGLRQKLEHWHQMEITNTMNVVTGAVKYSMKVLKV